MTIPNTSMNTHRKFGRSSLGGMGWRATASSRPGRFQTKGMITDHSGEEQFSSIAPVCAGH